MTPHAKVRFATLVLMAISVIGVVFLFSMISRMGRLLAGPMGLLPDETKTLLTWESWPAGIATLVLLIASYVLPWILPVRRNPDRLLVLEVGIHCVWQMAILVGLVVLTKPLLQFARPA